MSKRYTLLKKDGKARRGRFVTPHGTIETPVSMNVGTLAAIKGAVSSMDLKDIGRVIDTLGEKFNEENIICNYS